MTHIIFDLIILAVLIAAACRGYRRGLILSLFSLLAVVVALVGAIILSNLWSPALSQYLQPKLSPSVTSAVESVLPESTATAADDLFRLLEEADLPFGLEQYLPGIREDGVAAAEDASHAWVEALSGTLTEQLADSIAKNGLFILAFILILSLWKLLARALDLAARLPVLHTLNQLGGLLIGLLRGALLLFLLGWLVRWLFPDLIPSDTVEQSTLLHFFLTTRPMQYLEP